MEYLNSIGRNALAYFILDKLGIAEAITQASGIERNYGNGAKFSLAYTGINEAMDFLDDGRSNITTGNYTRVADGAIYNLLYVLGVQRTRVDSVIDEVLNTFGIPDGDIRVSVINGILITLAGLVRQLIDTQAPKQMRIITQPVSFAYATSTGNTNAYL